LGKEIYCEWEKEEKIKMAIINQVKCKSCKKKIDQLDVFSGGVCVDCYERQYNKNLKKTGVIPKPNFRKVFR
jgi:hypothetical protein